MFGEFVRDSFRNFWDGSRRDVGQIKWCACSTFIFYVPFLQADLFIYLFIFVLVLYIQFVDGCCVMLVYCNFFFFFLKIFLSCVCGK